jgi:hypothetical protein
MILLLSRDLFFASKVTGTAQQLGLPAATVMSLDALRDRLAEGDVTSVILDLSSGIAPADVQAAILTSPRPRLIAFGAHVDTAALQSAQQAGFDDVLPRSKFSATLPELLSGLAHS